MSDLDRDAGPQNDGQVRGSRAGRAQGGTGAAGLAALAVLLGCIAVVRGHGWGILLLPLAAFGLVWLAVATLFRTHHPARRFGPANTVTLIRAAMVCSLLAPLVADRPAGWTVAAISLIALSLDGVDGWLARRSGLASACGARFDIEVDSALALMLALHAWLGTALGPEVLALGLMRYAFVIAAAPLPWLAAPLPPSFRRKAICVVQLATLILLQLPGLPVPQAIAAGLTALALLTWSFATDILWLRARRG